jgi:N-acetylglucosamine-6-sulfatase
VICGAIPTLYVKFHTALILLQNCSWVDDSHVVHTGDAPEDYTTSLVGNKSISWIKSILAAGPTHPPFFAWLGPHAPHLPSTPAPWYLDHPIGKIEAPRDSPYYNHSASDKHAFFPYEPAIGQGSHRGPGCSVKSINAEYSKRLRSLLSVDDIVVDLEKTLTAAGEWDNTFVVLLSDHGYSQGQFRLCSHKMQVYDHGTRVPALIRGPGIEPGLRLSAVIGMVDIAPTLLELAGGTAPESM